MDPQRRGLRIHRRYTHHMSNYIDIDRFSANEELMNSLKRAEGCPVSQCSIDTQIDTVMNGKNCLTYQYILMTALVAKATDYRIDCLSLQIDDESDGAYAARSLCKEVVYPFQKQILGDVLGGSNNDPLVNNPGRYPRLTLNNPARGDGKKARNALITAFGSGRLSLTTPEAGKEAKVCLDYLLTHLLSLRKQQEEMAAAVSASSVKASNTHDLRAFLSELLDQSFGGASLVLSAACLCRIVFPESAGYVVEPHPVNQSGRSSKQLSDLDVKKDGKPVLCIELKDRQFTKDDVARAANTASSGNVPSLLFVGGRMSGLTAPPAYFADVRQKYAQYGMYVGVAGIDEMMDIVLSVHAGINVASELSRIYDDVRHVTSSSEVSRWIYQRLNS